MEAVKTEKKAQREERLKNIRSIIDMYGLRAMAFIAAAVVFVIGFFMQIQYKSTEQVQTKLTADISIDADITGLENMMAFEISFDQSMYSGVGALFVGFDLEENLERQKRIMEVMEADVGKVIQENFDLLLELGLLLESQDGDTEGRAVELLDELSDKLAASFGNVNLVELDRLEAEIAIATQEEQVSESMIKLADETIIRTALLAVSGAIYTYLQVLSLLYVIIGLVNFTNKKPASSKFFVLYLIGFFALMLFSQITATGLNGAAIACFAIVAAMCFMYLLGKAFVENTEGKAIVNGAIGILSAGFLFAAACLFAAPMYGFGVSEDKLGALLGYNCFNGYIFAAGEASEIIINLFVPLSISYIVGFLIVVGTMLVLMFDVRGGKMGGMICSLVATGYMALQYCALSLIVAQAGTELMFVGKEMLVIAILCCIAVIVNAIGSKVAAVMEERSKDKQASGGNVDETNLKHAESDQ